jgi:hypothetical protein
VIELLVRMLLVGALALLVTCLVAKVIVWFVLRRMIAKTRRRVDELAGARGLTRQDFIAYLGWLSQTRERV